MDLKNVFILKNVFLHYFYGNDDVKKIFKICRWGFGGKAPSRRRHGFLGAEPPALENFAFFCKNNFILGLFDQKLMLLKRGLEIGSANMIKLVA